MLIDVRLLVIVFLAAAWIRFRQRQYEHMISRLVVVSVYAWIWVGDPTILAAREYSRYAFLILGVTELVSYITRACVQARKK